jgi:hypothetical protein
MLMTVERPAIRRVDGARFAAAVNAARAGFGTPRGCNLAEYDVADYRRMACFLTADGLSGFAVQRDGTLTNLFSLAKGRGSWLVEAAIARGADRLDCFDGYLAALYRAHGFEVVETYTFDPAYAPAGWDVERDGRPDVLVMQRRAALAA